MKDATTIMANEEEAVEDSEGDGVDCEEIHRGNHFPVVLEKCHPTSDLVGIPRCSLDPARNCSLRDIETKHLQFPMNPGSTPGRVLRNHFEDKLAQFLADSLSSI